MSYHGLGFTASASLSTSGGFSSSTKYLLPGSSIDWGMVCSGKGGLASKSYVSDADYSFKCGDGFGCRKKPGSSDVCGYSSGSAPPPPPPSFQPFSFVGASYGPSLSTIAAAASKPAPAVSYIPGLSFSTGTNVASYIPTTSSEAAPPVATPTGPVEEKNEWVVPAVVVGGLVVAGAIFYFARKN